MYLHDGGSNWVCGEVRQCSLFDVGISLVALQDDTWEWADEVHTRHCWVGRDFLFGFRYQVGSGSSSAVAVGWLCPFSPGSGWSPEMWGPGLGKASVPAGPGQQRPPFVSLKWQGCPRASCGDFSLGFFSPVESVSSDRVLHSWIWCQSWSPGRTSWRWRPDLG